MNRSIIKYLTEEASEKIKDASAVSFSKWVDRIGKGGSFFTPIHDPNKKPQDLLKKLPEKPK